MTAAFDKYSDTYRETVERSIANLGISHDYATRAKSIVLNEIISERHGTAPLDILDIGCGIGALHPLLKSAQRSLTGVDISAESVSRAAQSNPWARYESYDGSRLPFDDDCFDFTLTVCVLHHVPPPQHTAFVSEMRRVTRKGGTVCAIEHNPFNPLTRLAVLRCPFDEDAVLLRAGYAKSLFSDARLGATATRFFLTLPSQSAAARSIERGLEKIPFGAQYATAGTVEK